MKSFALERWDGNRLTVNAEHAALFRHAGLHTFEDIWRFTEKSVAAKNLRADRVTLRFTLTDPAGNEQTFFIKRHRGVPWIDYVKPLLQLNWPSVGARPEWDALLEFHRVGLATMTPVAIGETANASFLITAAIEGCDKLSEVAPLDRPTFSRVRSEVALLARRMHRAGLHHQDFYLGHLMRPRNGADPIHIIDLGRVQRHKSWTAARWIIKDLAQLNYSARSVTRADRLRFLSEYLGRPLSAADRALVQRIARKTARIGRHSRKNGL